MPRGWGALLTLIVLAGCQSSPTPATSSLPAPRVISDAIPAPSGCVRRMEPGEPSLAADPRDPKLLAAAWQESRAANSVGNVVAVSQDGGASWIASTLPGVTKCTGGIYVGVTDPWVSIGPDGAVYVSALATRAPGTAGTTRDIVMSVSRDRGRSWAAPVIVESVTAPPSQPDKDAMLADPTRPGYAYSVWVEYATNGGGDVAADQVFFARTTDQGRTWSKPAAIYRGGDEAQQNQLLMTANGTLIDVFVEGSLPATPHPPPVPVRIRVIRSTDQGQTWSTPIEAATFTYTNAVDPGNGAQLRFFGQDITAAAAGNAVYVGWFENHADFSTIRVARSEDSGLSWKPSQVVIRERPEAFLPTLAVAGDATVGVLWFDFRQFAGGQSPLDTDVWISTSRNRGVSWRERHAGGPFDLRSAPAVQYGPFIGDYMGLVGLPDGFGAAFVQARPRSRNGPTDVFFLKIPSSG